MLRFNDHNQKYQKIEIRQVRLYYETVMLYRLLGDLTMYRDFWALRCVSPSSIASANKIGTSIFLRGDIAAPIFGLCHNCNNIIRPIFSKSEYCVFKLLINLVS